ncbi:MAG: o-succinylbenzoate--CoA ligase, partial [Opitutaceae bacterium]|nr:o-succinylbenzoate--CoA ligase [Opitutaceae bacterium]
MERAELSEALRPWRSRGPSVQSGAPTFIMEAQPEKFMTAFADAVAGSGEIFLGNPAWGETERASWAALRTAAVGTTPASGLPLGWLGIPTGGTSGQLKFARHDHETLSAAVRGFAQHFGLTQVNAVGVLPLYHVSGLMAWLRCA